MLDSEETFSMIGDPQFDTNDYIAEDLRSTLEHFFEHNNIPAYKGGIMNMRRGFVNEFDLAIYRDVASTFPEIMIHIECEQMSNIMTVRAPFPPKIVHELAQIIASCYLRVDLIDAPKSKFADPKFTIDGTYEWIVDKWNKQLKSLIEEIRDFLRSPEKASKDRWRLFLPGTMPKNQLLPFLEPYHVKQIHMVLSKYESTNPRRHRRLMQDILYPYSQTIRELMDYAAPDFLPVDFKVKSASLCMKIRQLGADFSNPEARYCVIDRHFMSRGGDNRASWDRQYTRCYEAMIAYLDELAQHVREHDEAILNPPKVIPVKKVIVHKTKVKNFDELSQDQAAKDFCVSRKTIVLWEKQLSDDGTKGKSNRYGYYKDLRTNPDLRGAYDLLSKSAKAYEAYKEKQKKDGKRTVNFVRFNEAYLEHNQKSNNVTS